MLSPREWCWSIGRRIDSSQIVSKSSFVDEIVEQASLYNTRSANSFAVSKAIHSRQQGKGQFYKITIFFLLLFLIEFRFDHRDRDKEQVVQRRS